MTISAQRKQTLWRYFEDVEADHSTGGELLWRKNNHMGSKVFRSLRQEWELEKRGDLERKQSLRQALMNLEGGLLGKPPVLPDGSFDAKPFIKDGELDVKPYLIAYRKQVLDNLLTACASGNAQALKIYHQLTGDLVEKQEVDVKIGLSADEITRRNLEADRQLEQWGKKDA